MQFSNFAFWRFLTKLWGRRHKLYIFEIINSGCHLSYNFLHFEINLHLSYIIVNSGCYMLHNSIFSKINIHLLYQQIQNCVGISLSSLTKLFIYFYVWSLFAIFMSLFYLIKASLFHLDDEDNSRPMHF